MKKFIQNFGWSLFGGFALNALFDIKFWNWKFWAFVIPLVILVEWYASGKNKK